MPDRSFEQQVREELADLRIQPDAASWEVVAASLQRERKRRWALWLLLLAICCGGSWMWWELQTKKEHHQPVAVNRQHPATHDQQLNKEKATVNGEFEKNKGVQEIQYQPQKRANLTVITGAGNKINRVVQKEEPMPAREGIHTETQVQNEHNALIEKKEMSTATVLPETTTDSVQQQKQVATPTEMVITKEKTLIKDKKKWQVHLFANAGSSGIRNAILRTSKASADMYYSLPSSNLSNGTMPSATPPAFHDAFSFNLGIEFNKTIGKKNALGFSLGYGLYQDYVNVGPRKDSILGSVQNRNNSSASGYYYRNIDSMKYINRYHFLEVSVHLYTPFRLFHVLPFRWELGAGVSVLLGSNGLHYNGQSNYLFSNNDLIRKLNLDISTGFDVGIGKHPFLYVGPQTKFFITNLSRQEGTKQYLWQPSLRAVYVFPQWKH